MSALPERRFFIRAACVIPTSNSLLRRLIVPLEKADGSQQKTRKLRAFPRRYGRVRGLWPLTRSLPHHRQMVN